MFPEVRSKGGQRPTGCKWSRLSTSYGSSTARAFTCFLSLDPQQKHNSYNYCHLTDEKVDLKILTTMTTQTSIPSHQVPNLGLFGSPLNTLNIQPSTNTHNPHTPQCWGSGWRPKEGTFSSTSGLYLLVYSRGNWVCPSAGENLWAEILPGRQGWGT